MKRTLLSLFVFALAFAASASAAVIRLAPVSVPGLRLGYVPETGRLLKADGARLGRSMVWSDSKASAFHLSPTTILKVYAAPQAKDGERAQSQAELNALGRAEVERINSWAAEGLALPVLETGETEDGTFYAVLEKPRRGVSGTHLVKREKYTQVSESMRRLAERLNDNRWKLGTFNPTQVYVERGGQKRALLIKAYSYDERDNAWSADERRRHYDERLAYFSGLEEMYRSYRQSDALSEGSPTSDPTAVARMTLEAIRGGKDMRIVYRSGGSGREKVFHVRPLPDSLKKDGFLKGYFRALVFPESGPSKVYTFRLDRIGEARFLQPSA